MFLTAWQTEPLTVTVLTTEHHVLAHGGDDDISILGHGEGLGLVGFLAGIHLTVQDIVFPGTLIAEFAELGLDVFRPVATS